MVPSDLHAVLPFRQQSIGARYLQWSALGHWQAQPPGRLQGSFQIHVKFSESTPGLATISSLLLSIADTFRTGLIQNNLSIVTAYKGKELIKRSEWGAKNFDNYPELPEKNHPGTH